MKIQTKHPDAFTSLAYVFGIDDHVFLDLNYPETFHTVGYNYFNLPRTYLQGNVNVMDVVGVLVLGTRYFIYENNVIIREIFIKDFCEHTIKFLNTIKLSLYELNKTYYHDYYIPKYSPVIRFLNLTDFISLEDAYVSVYNYLLEQNLSKECTVEISNLDKLQQHGFDKKVSFRHR